MATRITQKTIEKLKAPATGYEMIWDGETRGFAVRITSNDAVSFILDYRTATGRHRRYTIGRYPEMTLQQARDEAEDLRSKIRKGADPLLDKERARGEITMSDFCDRYLSEYSKVHKRSYRDDLSMIGDPDGIEPSGRRRRKQGIIRPKLGRLTLSAVDQRDIMSLHSSLKATPYRANRVLALLSKMFNIAIAWKLRSDNPAKGVPRFHEERRERWLSEEQIGAFRDALDSYHDQNAANALRLLILTGSRAGEVLKADWSQFDMQRAVWTKPSHHTKQKKIEHVQLSPETIEILCAMRPKGAQGPLFPGRTGKKARVSIRRPWVQACKAAGLVEVIEKPGKRRKKVVQYKPTVRLHDLRHTFASHLVSKGQSLQVVGKLLGHTQSQTTQRYAHLSNQAQQTATNVFGDIFKKSQSSMVH